MSLEQLITRRRANGTVAIVLGVVAACSVAGDGTRMTMPSSPQDELGARPEVPRLMAVRFHHDLCPYCKQLDPLFDVLAGRTNDESVLFVTLDVSTEASQKQAALLTAALGIEAVWPGNYSKLGSVAFVDGKTKKLLSTVRAYDAEALHDAVDQALKSLAR